MTELLPPTAVLRLGRVTFDPSRYDAVAVADQQTSEYLIPAIKQLPGLLHWFAGVSPQGSLAQASIWDTDEHAAQMNDLKAMRVRAREDLGAIGVTFTAETAVYDHYPIDWTIWPSPADPIPATAVVRVSLGTFDPARFSEVQEMTVTIAQFLVPAVEALPGLISYHAGETPEGSLAHVSVWESDEHANQMGRLKEMIVDARQAAEKVGVSFPTPIVNYPITWTI